MGNSGWIWNWFCVCSKVILEYPAADWVIHTGSNCTWLSLPNRFSFKKRSRFDFFANNEDRWSWFLCTPFNVLRSTYFRRETLPRMSMQDLERRVEELENDYKRLSDEYRILARVVDRYEAMSSGVRWVFAILAGGAALLASIKAVFGKLLTL